MKKKLFVLIIAVCMLLFTSCNTRTEKNGEAYFFSEEEAFTDVKLVKWGDANRFVPGVLEELEKASDAIIIGTFVGDTEQKEVYMYDNQVERDTLVNVITYSDIEVSKSFKGDFKVGDIIKYAQEYAVLDNEYVTFSDLTPALEDDTWLFFLYNNYDSGVYYCCGDSDGRYPVKNFTYRRNALTENEDLGVFDKKNFNQAIYDEILEKYDL